MLQKGLMNRDRILELALEELNRQKAGIDAEIESIQSELRMVGSTVPQGRFIPSAGKQKGRKRTAAERRAASLRMKQIWAARRRAQATKKAGAAKTPVTKAKVRTRTEAERKALSLKMKQVWRRRRAEAAKKVKAA
jgi:hypothetical protein